MNIRIAIHNGVRTASERRVLKLNYDESLETIWLNASVPACGDACADDSSLIVDTVDIVPDDNRTWMIDIHYIVNTPDNVEAIRENTRPWLNTPRLQKISMPEVTRVTDKFYKATDAVGTPTGDIRLPTGKPFQNPPMLPVKACRYILTWSTQINEAAKLAGIEYSVNSDNITLDGRTRAPQTLYCEAATCSRCYTAEGVLFYRCKVQMYYNPENHKYKPLFCDYDAFDSGTLKPICLDAGAYCFDKDVEKRISDPARLNASGALLDTNPASTTASVYGDFAYIAQTNWTNVLPPTKTITP